MIVKDVVAGFLLVPIAAVVVLPALTATGIISCKVSYPARFYTGATTLNAMACSALVFVLNTDSLTIWSGLNSFSDGMIFSSWS